MSPPARKGAGDRDPERGMEGVGCGSRVGGSLEPAAGQAPVGGHVQGTRMKELNFMIFMVFLRFQWFYNWFCYWKQLIAELLVSNSATGGQ